MIRKLEKAGFVCRGGKGSHSNYKHPAGVRITLSGKAGDDAKPYQEKSVSEAIRRAKS
jgi:predicted RNA binding protein YcfA (HicA-like mRNA interferase family)